MTAVVATKAAGKAAAGKAGTKAAGTTAAKAKSGARADLPLTGTFGDEDDPMFGPPSKGDIAAMKSQARARDKPPAGAEGGPAAGSSRPRGGGGSGGKPAAFRPANALKGKSMVPGGSMAEEGAGFLLGLFAYALLVNFLRAGPTGVKAWLAAKFINKTSSPTAAAGPPPTIGAIASPQYFGAFPARDLGGAR